MMKKLNRKIHQWCRFLTDIVEANGGTVTSEHNRAQLLQDWLDSYEEVSPQYYYELNGVDSYVQTPLITVGSDDISIEVDAVISAYPASGQGTIISGSISNSDAIVVDVGPTGTLRFFAYVGSSLQGIVTPNSQLSLNTEYNIVLAVTSNTATMTINGVLQDDTETWALNGSQNINYAGTRSTIGGYLDGVIKSLNVQGSLTVGTQSYSELNYPIVFDNIGDTTISETVSGNAALDSALINSQDEDYVLTSEA